jgi:GT2 family glycosyltransferase
MRPNARYGVVVLTMGRRPGDLDRALRSLLGQTGVDLDIVVVGNGWDPVGLPAGVRAVALPANIGIPAGRNAGVARVTGDLLFFLDDDASVPEPDTLARIAGQFAAQPDIGLIQPRVATLDGSPAPRRWTPRLRVGDPVAPATSPRCGRERWRFAARCSSASVGGRTPSFTPTRGSTWPGRCGTPGTGCGTGAM